MFCFSRATGRFQGKRQSSPNDQVLDPELLALARLLALPQYSARDDSYSNRNTHILEAWSHKGQTDSLLEFSPLPEISNDKMRQSPPAESESFDYPLSMMHQNMEERNHVRREASVGHQISRKERSKKNQRDELKREGKRRRDQKKRNRERKNGSKKDRWLDKDNIMDCCPSKLLVVEKNVGKARDYHAYEIHPNHKFFYERVCLEEYQNKTCNFPQKTVRKGVKSRCRQELSYSQALVRPYKEDSEWKIDYVEVRSGCSCQVLAPRRKKKRRRKR